MPRPNPHAPVRRVIDTCLWRDPKVMALGNPRSSPLMLFIFLATHPNSGRIPGVLVESLPSIAVRLGWKQETTKEMLQTLEQQGLVYTDSTHWLVWIPNAIKYNRPGGAGEMKLWAREWRGVPECALKERIAKELGEFLAPRPLLAAAFAKHCLAQPVVPPQDADKPAADAKTEDAKGKKQGKAKVKALTEAEQWESEFQTLWAIYPKRVGANPRKLGFQHFCARRRQGVSFEELKAGLERYARFCEATDKINTEIVMQASRFFGTSEPFREQWALPKGHVITADLETSPDFEVVLAAYPRQDAKAEAWSAWQRIQPMPDAALAKQMIAAMAEWRKYDWRPGRESFVPPLAKWLESMGWRRKFKQNGSSFEETAARFGAVPGHDAGNVYDGEVVVEPAVPALGLPKKPADPFNLEPIPARR